MKKITIIFLMLLISSFVFVGCGSSNEETSNTPNQTEGEKISKMLPDPKKNFENCTVNTMIGDSNCGFEVSGNITKDDYLAYVKKCKDKDFTIVQTDYSDDTLGIYYYYAYDSHKKYFISVQLFKDGDNSKMYIEGKVNSDTTEESISNEQQ